MSGHSRRAREGSPEQVYVRRRTGSLEGSPGQQESATLLGVWGLSSPQWKGPRGRHTVGLRRGAGLRSGLAFALSLQSVSLRFSCSARQ